MRWRRTAALGAAIALLALAGCLSNVVAWSQAWADVPVCCGGPAPAVEQAMGTLAITVQLAGGGGPPPPPGL